MKEKTYDERAVEWIPICKNYKRRKEEAVRNIIHAEKV